jgi:hypothetical protein
MTQFMRAHGNEPAPTQRPWTAGAAAGMVAAVPAAALLWRTGAFQSMSERLGTNIWLVVLLQVVAFAILGAIFGRLFNRAAQDQRAGWLFGISYGFLIWMLGPALVLQWMAGAPLAIGPPAMGLFGGHLLFGLALGLLFPLTRHLRYG